MRRLVGPKASFTHEGNTGHHLPHLMEGGSNITGATPLWWCGRHRTAQYHCPLPPHHSNSGCKKCPLPLHPEAKHTPLPQWHLPLATPMEADIERSTIRGLKKDTLDHGGATTTGPDATYPPAICQNSGGGGGVAASRARGPLSAG